MAPAAPGRSGAPRVALSVRGAGSAEVNGEYVAERIDLGQLGTVARIACFRKRQEPPQQPEEPELLPQGGEKEEQARTAILLVLFSYTPSMCCFWDPGCCFQQVSVLGRRRSRCPPPVRSACPCSSRVFSCVCKQGRWCERSRSRHGGAAGSATARAGPTAWAGSPTTSPTGALRRCCISRVHARRVLPEVRSRHRPVGVTRASHCSTGKAAATEHRHRPASRSQPQRRSRRRRRLPRLQWTSKSRRNTSLPTWRAEPLSSPRPSVVTSLEGWWH